MVIYTMILGVATVDSYNRHQMLLIGLEKQEAQAVEQTHHWRHTPQKFYDSSGDSLKI